MQIRRTRLQPVKETQMVSLADIAFLIIFFFLLCSTFMRDKVPVELPKLPQVAKTESSLSVTLDAGARIYLDGDPIPTASALEDQLREKLAGKTKAEECEVRFKCDKALTYKAYRPVYEAIANAGGVISIMHEIK